MLTSMGRTFRRSVRLTGFDYAGDCIYFITICSDRRRTILGAMHEEQIVLSQLGIIVQEEWLRTEEVRPGVHLGEFQIMPNHLHALLFIPAARMPGGVGTVQDLPKTYASPRNRRSLSSLIAQFKATVTTRARKELGFVDIWQRGFHDHIVRDSESLSAIERYIAENPGNWNHDPENPEAM